MSNKGIIDELEILLSAEDEGAAKAIDNVIDKLDELDKTAKASGKKDAFYAIFEGAKDAKNGIEAVNKTIEKTGSWAKRLNDMGFKDMSPRITAIQDKLKTFSKETGLTDAFDKASNKVNALKVKIAELKAAWGKASWTVPKALLPDTSEAGSWIDRFKAKLEDLSGRVLARGIIKAQELKFAFIDFVKNLPTTLVNGFIKVIQKASSIIGDVAKKTMSLAAFPFQKIGSSLASIGKKITGIGSGLMRIAKFRIYRTIIKLITSGFKEGIDNAYKWSSAMGGQFATSMNNLATSANYLKNSLGAMAMPLINVVAPAFDRIVDKIVAALNVINQFIATLTNATTWTKANRVVATYGGSVDSAAAAAEDLEDTLITILGIDEINPMEGAKDSADGGGGGGGVGDGGIGDMFSEEQVSNKVSDWAKMVKEAWERADFTEIGRIIGNKINDVIDGIPWQKIKKTVGKIGKSLATLFNGMIETINWTNMGNALAEGLNTAIRFMHDFVVNFNWTNLGTAIGNFINGALNGLDWLRIKSTARGIGLGIANALNAALDTTDWTLVGKTLAEALNTLIELAYAFVTKFKWTKFGTSIGEGIMGAINNIDWKKIYKTAEGLASGLALGLNSAIDAIKWTDVGGTISKGLNTAFLAANTFAKKFDWKDLGKAVGNAITGMIAEFDWAQAAQTFSNWAKGILQSINSALGAVDWQLLGKSVATFIANIDWAGLLKQAFKLVGSVVGAIMGFFEGAFRDTIDAINKWWKENSLGDTGESAFKAFLDGMLAAIKGIGNWIYKHIFRPFIDGFEEAFGIGSPSKVMEDEGGYIIDGLLNGLKAGWKKLETWWSGRSLPKINFGDNPFGYGNNEFVVPVTASYTKGKDNIDPKEKIIGGIEAAAEVLTDAVPQPQKQMHGLEGYVEDILDNTPEDKKNVNGITGVIQALLEQNIPEYQKRVGEMTGVVDTLQDRLPQSQKNVHGLDGYVEGFHDEIKQSQKNVDGVNANVESKTVNKKKFDENIDMNANFTGTQKDPKKFNSTVTGMISEFADRTVNKGKFKTTISGMNAEFGSRSVTKGKFNPTISGMNSEFSSRSVNKNKFSTTISGMNAQFSSGSKGNSFNSNLSMNAVLSKTTGYSVSGTLRVTEVRDKNNRVLSINAKGGSFYGGKWHGIAQYAGGGEVGHGSMFIAGEAGAELVGHIGGRTEVLNQSQMAAALAAGMEPQSQLLRQLVTIGQQMLDSQGSVRAYITNSDLADGIRSMNRREGKSVIPMGV